MMEHNDEKEKLIQAIRVLDKRLKEMNEKLLESESFKQSFISNLKNELMDPITTIFLVLSNIVKANVDCGELREYLTIMYRETLNVYHKCLNIFTAADFESGEVSLKSDKILVKNFLEDVIDLFALKIKEKNVEVDLKIMNEFAYFITDAEKFRLIFMNILNNSIYYAPDGSKISINAWMTKENLNIVFADTGGKFDDEDINKNFIEILSTGVDSYKSSREKNLSIAVTKMLIEFMNGSIVVTSKENETVIAIHLPSLQGAENISLEGNKFFFDDTETF
ncbi:MAG: HAMP domain-containing histidine kinase [Calditerrivibrio sp.]|nr:HAMP domain-containing histidine kinase [Calditerrivibrio sp.]